MSRTIAFLLLICCALPAQQDQGVITGLVPDSTGGVITGARVTVTDRDTAEIRAAETSATGTYTVGPLRVGNYDVSVEKQGFKKALWQAIAPHAADRVRADFQLEVGQVIDTVSITAEAPFLQSEASSLAHVVEQ